MKIIDDTTQPSTIILAFVALLIIGATLFASTWHMVTHQSEAEEEHLRLASKAVLLSINSSLRLLSPLTVGGRLSPEADRLFSTLEQDGDIVCAGLFMPATHKLLVSTHLQDNSFVLPEGMVQTLVQQGEWQGRLPFGDSVAYIAARRLNVPPSQHVASAPLEQALFLLVAIDLSAHLQPYALFKRNALFQSGYILLAAFFMWWLTISFLSRREQANKAARLEEFHDKLIDSLPDALLTITVEQQLIHIRGANPAALHLLGLPTEALLQPGSAPLPPAIADCILHMAHEGCPQSWQPVNTLDASLEIRLLPLYTQRAPDYMLIIRDRTDLQRLERHLAETEKLAALGTLAAGVAHEVRNPLSALRGFAQYFVKKLAGMHPEESYARTMVQEADRLNRVITDLLFLTKPRELAVQRVSLPESINEIRQLLHFELDKAGVRIHSALTEQWLWADPDALKQCLINLCLNSLDALAASPLATPGYITISSGSDQQQSWLEVADNGVGMPASSLRQMFTPFFTQKAQGTGLGLALVERIMHQHGGTVSAHSVEQAGTSIRLVFPGTSSSQPTATLHTPLQAASNSQTPQETQAKERE